MISNRRINYTLALPALIVALVASSAIVVFATATEEVSAHHPHPKSIVDLSKDFIEDTAAMTTSPGAAKIVEIASSDPLMRAAVVLENGKVVAKYHRDDVDENTPNQVWSTTKSWMSMLIGILVDSGVLSIDETLGDIFTDDSVWDDVDDGTVDFRKSVKIKDMLTMTSGLVCPPEEDVLAMLELPVEELAAAMGSIIEAGASSNSGGASLSGSLSHPAIAKKGEFSYLGMNNILSYVIKERTGMTPQAYLSKNILPKLGIKESEHSWWQTSGKMQYSYHGLELTALQMAKLPQLYLQGGQYKPSTTSSTTSGDSQLVSKAWVDASVEKHAEDEVIFKLGYGYLWWVVKPGLYCTIGMFGQDSCFDMNTGRVMVQQRDMDEANPFSGNLIIPIAAADPELSFATESSKSTVSAEF